MDTNKPALAQMIDILRKEGNNDDQIADFLAQLSGEIAQAFYNESLAVLTDEDMKAIEKATMPEEAGFEIRTRYHKRTGKNASHVTSQMYEDFARKFIESYNQQTPPSSPQNPQALDQAPQPQGSPSEDFHSPQTDHTSP